MVAATALPCRSTADGMVSSKPENNLSQIIFQKHEIDWNNRNEKASKEKYNSLYHYREGIAEEKQERWKGKFADSLSKYARNDQRL
jgi:hypothetical protein